jgi:hypothetical protein
MLREFAKCMRANGIERFPDPDPNGMMMLGPASGDLRQIQLLHRSVAVAEPTPEILAAFEKCRQNLPQAGMPSPQPATG